MEFVSPPPEKKGQRSERWREIVQTLKSNKGEWALVGNFSPGVATHIRNGEYRAFLDDFEGTPEQAALYMKRHWEVTTRKTDGSVEGDRKRNDVYIRYLG